MTPSLQQPREQPRQDHRVGRVGHLHLVEAEQLRFCRDRFGNRLDRVAFLGSPDLAQPAVGFEHELVEVHPALGVNVEMVEGQVHQHRLAATDAAPQIGAAGAAALTAEQAGEEAALVPD